MRTGQDPFNSAIQAALRLQRGVRETRLSGRWGAADPNTLAAAKANNLRRAKGEATRSGDYFANNVRERQTNLNRKALESFMQRKSAIDNQQ